MGAQMSKAWTQLTAFGNDERGAALVEYSAIMGIIVGTAIVVIGAIGLWVSGTWATALGLLP